MCVLGSGMCFGMKDKSHGCILIANIYSRLFSHVTPGYFVYQRLCNLHTASCFWFAMDLSLEYGHTAVLPSTRSSQQHQNQIWIRLNDNPLVTDIGSPCSRTYWQPHQLYIFSVGETLSSIIISNTTHCQLSLSLHSYLPGNRVFALIMRTTGSVLFHLTSQPLILHRGANCSCDRSI